MSFHPTARARTELSRPMATVLPHLKGQILDFGCGRGFDVCELKKRGYSACGYDPFHPEWNGLPTRKYSNVTMFFVLNVIENKQEREQTLLQAASFARKNLFVAVRTDSVKGEPRGDGVITSRKTFQTQLKRAQWFQFLRDSLPTHAIQEIAPAVFVCRLRG
jgi:DNA phosphorothioation-associated putative methyltransferase